MGFTGLSPRLLAPVKIAGATWIPLTKNQFALVDDIDATEVLKRNWYATKGKHSRTYYAVYKQTKAVYLHVFIAERMGVPVTMRVDHRNHNGLDCRRSNLRLATSNQNLQNMLLRYDNTSGFKGVTKTPWGWMARIGVEGKSLYLGYYSTAKEAGDVYDAAALKYFGEFALTNAKLRARKEAA